MQNIAMLKRWLISGFLTVFLVIAVPPAMGMEQKVKISKKDCRWLVRHQPADDVAYKPGIDAYGRPVVPADLASNRRIKLPNVIAIPLNVPLGNLLTSGTTSPVGGSEVGVGLVTVDRNTGEVKYEGKSLVQDEYESMVVACRKLLRRGR